MAEHSEKKFQKNITAILREHGNFRRLVRAAIPVALVLVVAVVWGLHMNAVTLNSTELICGTAEHTHTESCYAWVSASGSVLTSDGIFNPDGTESVESTEDTEGIESTESTEAAISAGSAGTTEATEQVVTKTGVKEEESTEATALIEDMEEAESMEATESIEGTESTEESVLPTDAQAGDTVVVDGVEYTYTLTCAQEEHTHTDACYATDDGSESESDGDDDSAVLNASAEALESETGSEAGANVSADGSEENITGTNGIMLTSSADDSEEDSEEVTESTSSESDNATLTSTSSTESVTYSADEVVYDETTGTFSVTLTIDFVFQETGSSYSITDYDTSIINDSNYDTAYRIQLPDGMIVPDSLLGASHNGYLSGDSANVMFKYYFVSETDESSGETVYYVYIVFLDKTILEEDYEYTTDSTLEGYITYGGYFSSSTYDKDGDCIKIEDTLSTDLAITVEGSKITYPGNSTVTKDISTVKSGTYDSSTNTITYSVIVYSKKGTGSTIELTDAFTDTGFSEILGELTGVSYEKTTVTYTTSNNVDYGVTAASGGETVTLTEDSTATTAPYYYTDEDGTIHIVLDGLEAYTEDDNTSNAYVVTYTYTVDPEYQTTYSSTNSVTASTDYSTLYEGSISDTDTSTVYVKGSTVISKTGAYDSSGTITWTITVGDGNKDITGYALSDDMITGLTANDITIKDANGEEVTGDSVISCYRTSETDEDGNVTYTYYSDASMEDEITDISSYAIVYVLDADSTDADGNNTVLTILFNSGSKYTITYTTEVDNVWNSQTVTNTAEFTYEGSSAGTGTGGGSYSSTYSTYITGAGTKAFKKECADADETEDTEGNITLVLSWTTTFTVPKTGIPKGTVFTDYVSDSSGSATSYITYEQAQTIITALNTAWGAENISIEFSTKSHSTSSSSVGWESASNLDSTGNTLYYQFRYTLLTEIEYDTSNDNNTINYSYTTTANPTGYDSITYYNTISDGSNSQSADHSWYSKVAKYGINASGNIANGDSTISSSVDEAGNVEVSWIVRLAVESDTTYTVTDTLPENVTLSALQVSSNGNYNYSDIDITDFDTTDVSTEVSGKGTFVAAGSMDTSGEEPVQVVTLTISGIETGVSVLYLKYTCTYAAGTEAEGTSTALTNNVSVTTGDTNPESYGDASQTTTVVIPSTSTETTDLTKSSAFDGNNNVLSYTVDINPDGETYTAESTGEAYADLTVTDTLSYYSFPGQGMIRSATLITSSLKLVDAETGEELDESEYSWTYSEDVETYDWGYTVECITHTITLTVPNGRHLSLKYEYSFTIVQSGTWTEYTTNATNTATLSAESDTIYTTPGLYDSTELSEVYTYGEASGGSVGYTIYKVDEDNFSVKLSGATYTLYAYDTSTSSFIAVGSYTTGTNGSVTISGSPVYDGNKNLVSYTVSVSNDESVSIPADTICFFVETEAPENYKLEDTKYYFYYGSSVSQSASDCAGYTSSASDAKNLVLSASVYITNEHSSDYYAAKTSISVLKTWFDANGDEYEKSDGSITFDLYRVLILNDGSITNSTAVESGDTSSSSAGSSAGSSGNDGVYLTWYLNDAYDWNGYEDEGTVEVAEDGTVTISIYYGANSEWWYYETVLYDVTDGGTTALATIGGMLGYDENWNSIGFQYQITDSDIVKDISCSNMTYTITLNVEKSMSLLIAMTDVYDTTTYLLSASVTSGTDTGSTSGGSEDTSSTSDDTEGTVYRLNFSDLYEKSDFLGEDGNYGDVGIIGYYGWTDDNKPDLSDASYEYGSTGFFYIEGTGSKATDGKANLSVTHGTASYDIDGDGEVDDGETDMDVCLKMESGAGTAISFTVEEGGYLTMVFNSDSSSNSVKLTNTDTNETEVLSPSTSLYVVYEYIETGNYTISYNRSCYLFYIEFEDGVEKSETETDTSIHNFNNGKDSVYYTIEGSFSYQYGTVSYDDIIASQCLKMNSSASITFTSEEAGTIYLIMTNPKGASVVGVTIDGEEVYATATTTANTQGYRIYTLMLRVEAGTHTITRINGTEVMLYYIAYMADDYDGKTWEDDAEDSPLKGLTSDEQTAYSNYAEYVTTVTISASSDWSWYSSTLPSEYIDTDTGKVLGEYYYYVVETKVNGEDLDSANYTTTYLNDDGISYGSIGISNKLTEESDDSTSITLQKSWVDGEDNTLAIGDTSVSTTNTYGVSAATITYGLYAVKTLYDTSSVEMEERSYSRTFAAVTSDDFYTVSGSKSPNGTTSSTGESYGNVVYGGTSTSNGLKLNSSGSVTFTAPATDGTLTLVFSTYNKNSGGNVTAYYGPNFAITGPDNLKYKYECTYDSTTKTATISVTSGGTDPYGVTCTSYSETDNAVVITLTLPSAGTYKVSQGSTECYLHYIDYTYEYYNAGEGTLIQTGTLSVENTIDSNSGKITWAKEISGLPLYIYSEDDNTVIGTYTYYVKETGISITVDGETYDLEYDSDKGTYAVSYMVDKIQYTYTVKSSMILTDGTTLETTEDPISSGSIAITNVLSLSKVETGTILPATGGMGKDEFYAIVAMLMGLCATMLLTHLYQERRPKRKGRQRAVSCGR